ncbi:MAG: oligopeptide transport system ATP-binding protein [Bradymonadia bacterium]|jgi:oligopeptide transport system ATP-binding protein
MSTPSKTTTGEGDALLRVDNLVTQFATEDGVVTAVDGLSFELGRGETLGIVGESGSGKSVTQLSILGLLPSPPARIAAGTAEFDGTDLLKLDQESLRKLRGNRVAMIFQDPMTSLNPFLSVRRQLEEVLELHTDAKKAERSKRAVEVLESVGIPDAAARIDNYPHQFSGGMRQRVMIAMALLCGPELLIADEPTTALDVTIQAQILELLNELRRERGTSIILITHDLGVVAGMADRVLVMYAGRVMERATTRALFKTPQHPYTVGLLNSLPRLDDLDQRLVAIPGQPPLMTADKVGCPFAPRCAFAEDKCRTEAPLSLETAPDHFVACHFPSIATEQAQ